MPLLRLDPCCRTARIEFGVMVRRGCEVKDRDVSRDRLLLAERVARMGFIEWDLATDAITWSDQIHRMYGVERTDTPPTLKETVRLVHPQDRKRVRQSLERVVAGEAEHDLEHRILRPDGKVIWVHARAELVRSSEGRPELLLGTVVDITERKRAEEALRESERLLLESQHVAQVGSYVLDIPSGAWKSSPTLDHVFGIGKDHERTSEEWLAIGHPDDRRSIADHFVHDVLENHGRFDMEYRIVRRNDGAERWVLCLGALKFDADGRPASMVGTIQDITERKRAEEALRESEQRMELALRGADLGTWDWNVETGEVRSNERWAEMFGYSHGEVEPSLKAWEKLVHPDDLPGVMEVLTAHLDGRTDFYETEHRVLHKSGKWVWVLDKGRVIERDADGKPLRACGTHLDITERKQAEEALLERTARYELIAAGACDAIWDWDVANHRVYFSPRWKELRGLAPDEVGDDEEEWSAGIHPDDASRVMAAVNAHFAGKTAFFQEEYRIRCKGGSWKWVLDRGLALRDSSGTVVRMAGSESDITERKRAEDRLSAVVETATEAIITIDSEGTIVAWNNAARVAFDYSADEIVGRPMSLLMPERYRADHERGVRRAASGEARAFVGTTVELVGLRKNGSEFPVEVSIAAWESGGGSFFTGVLRDITERKRVEEERERLSVAIDQTAEAIMITDTEGTIQYVNPAFGKITGYKRAEAVGQNPRILKSGKHDDGFYRQLWDTIRRGDTWRGRFVNRKKNGTLYTEETIISPILDASGQVINYVAVRRDISEELRLERQFRQAQKMESVGRLAGGVAHDFNNMLGVILGQAELALEQLEPAQPPHAELVQIREAAERSADLTRQLLAFARKQTIAPIVLDLNETVEGMLKMLRLLIGEDIDLAWLPEEGLWPVKVDPSQIDQILANLCLNARDAIEDVGKLTIATKNATLDETFCADPLGFVPGEYVLLAVHDNGCGMDKPTLDRVYEPFFTTKEMGKGTGLGLATIYGIVKQNNGLIDACSEPGQGTTFSIYLPRHATGDTRAQRQDRAGPAKRCNETILLVEDEPAILATVAMMLESQGYTVLSSSTPDEAMRLAEVHGGEIDLLLTDVVMPEMNGQALAQKLVSLYPRLKHMFMSGYTAEVIAQHGVLRERVQFIQKPFTVKGLAAKVRDALAGE